MKRRPIIIDCDPGHDDAMAILWALASEELEIKAITTVAGNQTIEKVTNNAIRVLTKAKKYDIPVAKGAEAPLVRKLVVGGELVHGDSGLEGPVLPENGFEVSELRALELLVKVLEESEEKVTIVGIGPLTNVAQLLITRPDLMEKIEQISIMGGGTVGNWTPAAEYNIFEDPEAGGPGGLPPPAGGPGRGGGGRAEKPAPAGAQGPAEELVSNTLRRMLCFKW